MSEYDFSRAFEFNLSGQRVPVGSEPTSESDVHSGPVRIEFNDTTGYVVVKCPVGHLVTARKLGPDWAGSWLEAKVSEHQHSKNWVVQCYGAM